jgi:uncharacterized protein (TIGR02757 family)
LKVLVNREILDGLYERYNRRELVHPDPLEFLYEYDDPADREIVALVASSLAYGRVAQILRSIRIVLERIGGPARFVATVSADKMRRTLSGFKHRFATGDEVAGLLYAAGRVIAECGSLEKAFLASLSPTDSNVVAAVTAFSAGLRAAAGFDSHLLPCPSRGSACKRLHLFMRWLVREDDVDPGGWGDVSPSLLVVPVDVHMHRICTALGLTARKSADLRTAVEITEAFKRFQPEDPVKYDFALTRLGIRDELDPAPFIAECVAAGVCE